MSKGLDESLSSFLLFEAYSSWWIFGFNGLGFIRLKVFLIVAKCEAMRRYFDIITF